jgi:hypothetical protein
MSEMSESSDVGNVGNNETDIKPTMSESRNGYEPSSQGASNDSDISDMTSGKKSAGFALTSSLNLNTSAPQADVFENRQVIRWRNKPYTIFKVAPDYLLAEDRDGRVQRFNADQMAEIRRLAR